MVDTEVNSQNVRRLLLGSVLSASTILFASGLSAQSFSGGFTFVLPHTDFATVPFLPAFPKRAIGSTEFVTINGDGHFVVHGAPIRFFGTNCVADGALPPKEYVWYIGGRLRKMGYNLIRFHHLDNSWTSTGSLFGGGTDTRHLNSVNLDRLDRFLDELKANGIYADMNLHVGRTFTVADGVPDADSLAEFAKGYTFFDPILIALQKEYARQLLTHINPYTGLSLIADPVMAMVEITNENSLYYLWRTDDLAPYAEGGILPVRHQRLLDSLWGRFLVEKYASEDSLRATWNTGMMAEGREQLTDGSYETQQFPGQWSLERHDPVSASVFRVTTGVYDGAMAAQVIVSGTDGTGWHVQWKHTGLSLTKDSTVIVRFAARADSSRQVALSMMQDVSPYTWWGGAEFILDTVWRVFEFVHTPTTSSTNNVRLSVELGRANGSYWFDAVSMKRAPRAGLLAGESLLQTPRRMTFSECGRFTDGRVRDMSAFVMKLQSDFYADMKRFLVDSLGVRVPIVGTNWNFGVPDLAVQSGLDYMDNHAYWDHPSFPFAPWSTTDWTITNQPMVTQPDGGTIGQLMGGDPVVGKPYTVSEYDHPFPNRYLSEGPLFVTAYGAFHSADAIMFFEYNGGSDWTVDKVSGYFDMHRNTSQMILMPPLAAAFRNGLIAPAKTMLRIQLSADDVLLAPKHDSGGWWGNMLASGTLPLVHAVRTETFDAPVSNLASLPTGGSPPFVSDTRELMWNPAGVFSVGAPGFAAVSGFPSAVAGTSASELSVVSLSDHATITWIALDGKPLVDARRSLLSIATRVQNTGMMWDGTTTIHNNWGSAPTLLQPVQTTLRLHLKADSVRIVPLTGLGAEGTSSRFLYPVDTNAFVLAIDLSADRTPWYGIEPMGEGVTSSVDDPEWQPARLALMQNFPNPFNPTTSIGYSVGAVSIQPSADSWVRLVVYDLLGREVKVLLDGPKEAGRHEVKWDASGCASGVYVYRLTAGEYVQSRRMVLLR